MIATIELQEHVGAPVRVVDVTPAAIDAACGPRGRWDSRYVYEQLFAIPGIPESVIEASSDYMRRDYSAEWDRQTSHLRRTSSGIAEGLRMAARLSEANAHRASVDLARRIQSCVADPSAQSRWTCRQEVSP